MTNRVATGYMGPGLVVRGRLTGSGDMEIDGRFDGDVEVQGHVAIGPTAVVTAPVSAASVEVAGRIRGDLTATGTVAVHEGGIIEGDVRAASIAIDDGGVLHGGIEMDFELPGDLSLDSDEER